MTTLTPVAGTTPGASLRFSRGYIVTGVVHAIEGEVTPQGDYQAVCGRTITAYTIFQSDAWARFETEPWKTHQTGVCNRCLTKTTGA